MLGVLGIRVLVQPPQGSRVLEDTRFSARASPCSGLTGRTVHHPSLGPALSRTAPRPSADPHRPCTGAKPGLGPVQSSLPLGQWFLQKYSSNTCVSRNLLVWDILHGRATRPSGHYTKWRAVCRQMSHLESRHRALERRSPGLKATQQDSRIAVCPRGTGRDPKQPERWTDRWQQELGQFAGQTELKRAPPAALGAPEPCHPVPRPGMPSPSCPAHPARTGSSVTSRTHGSGVSNWNK